MRKIKIAITGGHLTCALATISALRKMCPESRIIFFGRKHPMEGDPSLAAEYEIIPKLGIKFLVLTTGRLQRKLTRYTLISLFKIPFGFFQAFSYLLKERPDIICSFGGYLSTPVVFCSWLLRIPSITHEQTVIPGMATKINSFFVKKIALSWPETCRYFKNRKVIVTGNPIREEVFQKQVKSPAIKKFLEKAKISTLIYITGGNQGSHTINMAVKEIIPKLLKKYFVIHQTGDSKMFRDYEKLTINFREYVKDGRYFLTNYIGQEDIGAVLDRTDLVISRAGANIVTELLALGKPAILIPLPWSAGEEQRENAKLLANAGLAKILPQEKLAPSTFNQYINTAIGDLESFKKNVPKAKQLIRLDAAERLAREVLNLIRQ